MLRLFVYTQIFLQIDIIPIGMRMCVCDVGSDTESKFKYEVLKDVIKNQLISANIDTVVIISIK